ncbi:NUDIX hydrolase [uncultured Desulfuromusa sp.]|uniref:NUDIX hydrolase n=1 Tax=uncultured Desulfuromusa sp. TaxID=219183 RepID=UPI002AA64802|nr:NUDIX hydrolase [uncultured Desulfuromusa sp.]
MSKIAEEIIYRGRILDLAREVHLMPDSSESRFEIIKHPGGAAALPILDDGRLLLIRQFRPAAEDYIYEIPAGRLEIGENPSGCVERELEEEIGYRPQQLESLGFVYSSVGFCTEKIFLFMATQLQQTQTALEPDEFIEPWAIHLDKALEMISDGTITDAKTQIALLRYALKIRENA